MRLKTSLLLSLTLVAFASVAHAHLGLIDPPSRYGTDILKNPPCGSRTMGRSTNVVELAPGSDLTVRWDEYINHPGHYRIAFDNDGDDDFQDPVCTAHCDDPADPMPPEFETGTDPTVLMDMIPDMNGGEYSVTVTLPDVECDTCTLQVIQVMYDKRPYEPGAGNDIYYQCVDLVLTRSSGDAGPPAGDGGAGTDAGAGDGGGGGIDAGGSGGGGGCAVSSARGSAGTTPLLAVVAAVLMRRRRIANRRLN